MNGLEIFCKKIIEDKSDLGDLRKLAENDFDLYKVYPQSIHQFEESILFIALVDRVKSLIVLHKSSIYSKFNGSEVAFENICLKVCQLSEANSKVLRASFPFTNPTNHKGNPITIGLGDRLGLASAGHIRLIKEFDVFPILAQQSIRELNLTGRTYNDVLSDVSWAVFQEGYKKGFGADGDHLKTEEEVKMAINCGFTMITLDCSEYIRNEVVDFSESEVDDVYSKISLEERQILESKYLQKEFILDDSARIKFSTNAFKRIVLIYLDAIKHTVNVYNHAIKNCGRSIDFEMSIDETLSTTSPESHYFVAKQLLDQGVSITSLAPRFCGEFQKGIDYRGNLMDFTFEFGIHCSIAKHLGYKISVHSGSDKFGVFPIVGAKTNGVYHLKTAGTNWLEAVRVIAVKNPSLYRRMHEFALKNLSEAKKYYHISADPANVPDIDTLSDDQLPSLMEMDDSRQILHITYGLILQAKTSDGSSLFKVEIYDTLNTYEPEYYKRLYIHIGKHLNLLGL
jgi:tagaturonate epimerase